MHHDERRHDAGRDEVRNGTDRHRLEGVDLLADTHRAKAGREAAPDACSERERHDDRCELAGVGVPRHEADERRQADDVEAVVALEPDLGACKCRHQEHDTDSSTTDHERSATEAYLGEVSSDLGGVVADREGDLHDRHEAEPQEVAEAAEWIDDGDVEDLDQRAHATPPGKSVACV